MLRKEEEEKESNNNNNNNNNNNCRVKMRSETHLRRSTATETGWWK